jgi:hypothetical protein
MRIVGGKKEYYDTLRGVCCRLAKKADAMSLW